MSTIQIIKVVIITLLLQIFFIEIIPTKSAQGPTINKNFITPLRVVNDESKINTTQNVTTEKVTAGNKSNEDNVTTSKEHWRNGATLIMGYSTVSGLMEKNMSQNQKVKIRLFPGAKIKDVFHYAIPSLEKKHDYVILNFRANDTPYKTGLDISNEIWK